MKENAASVRVDEFPEASGLAVGAQAKQTVSIVISVIVIGLGMLFRGSP